MYQKLLIFLLFFLSGAVVNTAFGELEFESKEKITFSFVDDSVEDEENFDTLLQRIQKLKNKHFSSLNLVVLPCLGTPNFSYNNLSLQKKSAQNYQIKHHPFFLLFHAFLFYESF